MTNDTSGKPLPQITDMTRPFWTAAKNGKLVLQKCGKCGTFNFFPKPWCIECGSRDLAWTDAKPFGTVYSFTISHSVVMNFPGWKDDLPVLMCLIDLDDGVRLYGQLTDCKPKDVKIGMRVQAYFEDISDEAGIPKFRPA
ncbi:MAG TPA: Zn-ribbon domain-containing OB-fold protein [Sphingomicrobium sp.]|nr:Zn-ribbon domain-containing OB-fold protein [Sphingomicrobium sp.]